MIVELPDETRWARMPDPPFKGEPWVGQDADGKTFFATKREALFLDALEAATRRHTGLKNDIWALFDRHEADVLIAKLQELLRE